MKCERVLSGWKQIKTRINTTHATRRIAYLRMPIAVSHQIPVINTEMDLCLRFCRF